ncbi:hypothetical protein Lalb_Chr15g0085191 [Lupinus albus]|uniref:Uncharacterized protein n=1 Tax=Lupinus albus TaxID=3870 RepID=A0A6A4P297_LUPAL|nr:hypothetical protein Lalb_Chr15g0085191 [Lupinus albus]
MKLVLDLDPHCITFLVKLIRLLEQWLPGLVLDKRLLLCLVWLYCLSFSLKTF